MAVDNATILDRVRLVATNDYQMRIPPATQGSLASTMRALFDPLNREYWNQFIDILVNRIGMTIIRGDQWDNPLAAFKGARLNYGSTIQEIAPQWITAHSYDDADETLLKLARPEAAAWYHSQNRRDKYKLSINEQELRTAFTEEYGINNFITKLMQVPYNSDNYDEYRIMMQLIAEYESNWGFFKQGLDAYSAQTFDVKAFNEELLTQIRTYAGLLRFPSELYNAQDVDIPVFVPNPDEELILITTPKIFASLSVQTLASVFNVELAEIKYRTVIVDEFPIPNCDAILTTRDFFVCHDTLYQTDSFYDPNTLTNHYFLHHWGVYSVSPFVPAICFGNYETTGVNNVMYSRSASDVSGIAVLWTELADGTYLTNATLSPIMGPNPHTWDPDTVKRAIEENASDIIADTADIFNFQVDKWGSTTQFALIVNGQLASVTSNEPVSDKFTSVIGAGVNWSVALNLVGEASDDTSEVQANIGNTATHFDQYGKLHIQRTRPKADFDATSLDAAYIAATITVDDWSYDNPSPESLLSPVVPPIMPITLDNAMYVGAMM